MVGTHSQPTPGHTNKSTTHGKQLTTVLRNSNTIIDRGYKKMYKYRFWFLAYDIDVKIVRQRDTTYSTYKSMFVANVVGQL